MLFRSPSVMREPPPGANASLFTPGTVVMALLQGLSVLGACVLVQRLAADVHTVDAVRGLTLATLIVGVLTLIVANRSQRGVADAWRWHRNPALWMVLAGTLTVLAIMLGVPGLAPLFRVAPLHPGDLVLSLAAGVLCLLWVWPLRWLQRRAGTPAASDPRRLAASATAAPCRCEVRAVRRRSRG